MRIRRPRLSGGSSGMIEEFSFWNYGCLGLCKRDAVPHKIVPILIDFVLFIIFSFSQTNCEID
jgi:hypothetical protein